MINVRTDIILCHLSLPACHVRNAAMMESKKSQRNVKITGKNVKFDQRLAEE